MFLRAPPHTNGRANCSMDSTGRAYLNFRQHDPDNFFCHQQSIPLGTDKTDS